MKVIENRLDLARRLYQKKKYEEALFRAKQRSLGLPVPPKKIETRDMPGMKPKGIKKTKTMLMFGPD